MANPAEVDSEEEELIGADLEEGDLIEVAGEAAVLITRNLCNR
jgi:hypothetical protein